jgi:hypothetical protein
MTDLTRAQVRITFQAPGVYGASPRQFADEIVDALQRDVDTAGGIDGLKPTALLADEAVADASTTPAKTDVTLTAAFDEDLDVASVESAFRSHLVDRDWGLARHLAVDVVARAL